MKCGSEISCSHRSNSLNKPYGSINLAGHPDPKTDIHTPVVSEVGGALRPVGRHPHA
ncbi:hypothetical protein F511_44326 [Dorcoceras hygrometricum]|uniref:Uncharacterized protein n=1 Tax=Dorcoceras hygrometricum TaxID=472368 RepID=A0A2Z7C7T4_9LAMI|nr:hypothetical protein F511_44326 [Dorcoceras hygrometricum]